MISMYMHTVAVANERVTRERMSSASELKLLMEPLDDDNGVPVLDPSIDRYPCCLVWSPLPVISWVLPCVGHLGIANSRGVIYDFAGSYTINRDHFAFGRPTRYLQCSVAPEEREQWDKGIQRGCAIYMHRVHNLVWDNCHSHVGACLDDMAFLGNRRWDMVSLCFWVFWHAEYVDRAAWLKTWLPFFGVLLGGIITLLFLS